MNFDEKQFRSLADETYDKIISFGTTKGILIDKKSVFVDRLVDFLKEHDTPFDAHLCLEWIDAMEHDPPCTLSSSYLYWIAFRRLVVLIDKQSKGCLDHWTHYNSTSMPMPKNESYYKLVTDFRKYLEQNGYRKETARSYSSRIREFLIYLEDTGVLNIYELTNKLIADYFISDKCNHLCFRSLQTEGSIMRKFLFFLQESCSLDTSMLSYAIPSYHVTWGKIVTTVDKDVDTAVLKDRPEFIINKRDKAMLLLALHLCLRTCDIRNIKFSNINFDTGMLSIIQSKTGTPLELPMDIETQNAILDYILHERRECDSEYVFITAVGPAQKIQRHHIKFRRRTIGTDTYDKVPKDGLHILRRTGASRMLRSGVPLTTISSFLGHVSEGAVQRYLTTDEENMRKCSIDLSQIPYSGRDL
ncbi:MAG: tyrosine-type recombinase/integrase [Ruminococcus sp.]